MFQSVASLHRNDLSKCLLSELPPKKSGNCIVKATYTGRIENAQSDYPPVRKCHSHPGLLQRSFWNPDYYFFSFFLQAPPHLYWELPSRSLHKSSISFNNLRAPQPKGCLLMSPCQVALAATNGFDQQFHIIFNVFLIVNKKTETDVSCWGNVYSSFQIVYWP